MTSGLDASPGGGLSPEGAPPHSPHPPIGTLPDGSSSSLEEEEYEEEGGGGGAGVVSPAAPPRGQRALTPHPPQVPPPPLILVSFSRFSLSSLSQRCVF